MNTRNLLMAALLVSSSLGFSNIAFASGDHDHDHDEHETSHEASHEHGHGDSHEEAKEGPHGGTLLEEHDFTLELTIFEKGIPPEMRIYAYRDGIELNPEELKVEVTLDRLGGDQDQLRFSTEQDYLVSNQEVAEPHSFDVTVKATFEGETHEWHYDNHEGRTEISERLLTLAGVETEQAQGQQMSFKETLFGVIEAPQDQVFRLHAPYASIVQQVHVQVGDRVIKGQKLMTLRNTETLQSYSLKSAIDGEVTERFANQGDRANEQTLLEVSDLSSVWVEMSAFPASIEKLRVGQPVTIRDMHQHEQGVGKINYVAPQMTGGHIARARAVIANPDGHWRPGMHIKADIQTEQRQVELAVKTTALQSFRDMPVVFAKFGDTFEVRMVELGEENGEFVEVLGGLKPGTEYVTANSFLLKADVLKDGASHDH